MDSSIIIPIYNGKNLLTGCLLSLNHQLTEPDDHFEVIVIDDGSTDNTKDMLAALRVNYRLKYVYKERTALSSRSAARNVGIANASNEVLIFMDGDHIAPPTFVAEHLRAHKLRSDAVVIGFRKYLGEGKADTASLQREYSEAFFPPVESGDEREEIVEYYSENLNNSITPWFLFWTCNVSVRKEHAERAGGFDEDFIVWSLEDQELGYRLYKEGLTFVFNKNITVFHQYHPKEKGSKKKNWAINYELLKNKHPDLEILMVGIMGWLRVNMKDKLSWLECYKRFDEATRTLLGKRLNVRAPIKVLEITTSNLKDTLAQIQDFADKFHVMVFDQSSRGDLDLLVQFLTPRYELFYYRNPTPVQKNKIYEQYLQRYGYLTI